MNWLHSRLICHETHTIKPEDICDLMWIDEHPSRAARGHRAHKLSNSDHARLNMQMAIQQAGNNMTVFCLDNPSFGSNCMTRVMTNKGNALPDNRHGDTRDYFPGLNANPAAAAYDDIRRFSAHGDIDE
jgi:hypothetical protein